MVYIFNMLNMVKTVNMAIQYGLHGQQGFHIYMVNMV